MLSDHWDNRPKADLADAFALIRSYGYKPLPGERCPGCDRRVNRPRQSSSPTTKRVSGGNLPPERAEALESGLDSLQAFVGADGHSYPRGTLLEALVALGIQQREELRDFLAGSRAQIETPA